MRQKIHTTSNYEGEENKKGGPGIARVTSHFHELPESRGVHLALVQMAALDNR